MPIPHFHRISGLRENLRWSKRELARKAGVVPSLICKLEVGERVTRKTLEDVAEALGVYPIEILILKDE